MGRRKKVDIERERLEQMRQSMETDMSEEEMEAIMQDQIASVAVGEEDSILNIEKVGEAVGRPRYGIQMVTITIPVAPLRAGVHIPSQVNLRMRGPMSRVFRRVFDGMVQTQSVDPRGNKMSVSAPDVFAAILSKIEESMEQ